MRILAHKPNIKTELIKPTGENIFGTIGLMILLFGYLSRSPPYFYGFGTGIFAAFETVYTSTRVI
jgi:hypothetical protein